jgi:hypothetical protein
MPARLSGPAGQLDVGAARPAKEFFLLDRQPFRARQGYTLQARPLEAFLAAPTQRRDVPVRLAPLDDRGDMRAP